MCIRSNSGAHTVSVSFDGYYATSSTHVKHRKHDPLEERRRLIQRPLQRIIIMHMQLPIILLALIDRIRDIFADRTEHDTLEEHAGLWGLHVRDEYSGGGVACLGRPFFGGGEGEDAGPGGEGGDDFEGFRERAGAVGLEEEADSGVVRLG